ncbi:MAG: hypothetical protein HYT80_02685 [Euryarchaeota archaeon]|nr:hypothetical protein [Euryarchaeota archaeon]
MRETKVGVVEHYFPRRRAAVVRLEGELHLGDTVHIVGHGCDLVERVLSMEIEKRPVNDAGGGTRVGIEVSWPLREGATVFVAKPEYRGEEF